MSNFSYEDYKKFIESRQSGDVHTMMPEFKSDYMITLNDTLKNLGAKTVFDQGKCDLTGIAKPKDGNLFLSKVIHKTHIEVTPVGTRAGAATVVAMEAGCALDPEPPKEVILNRPFVYAIVDTKTSLPVFIGTVNSIPQK
jgi:serpin B